MFKIIKGTDTFFPNLAIVHLFFKCELLMYLSSQCKKFNFIFGKNVIHMQLVFHII